MPDANEDPTQGGDQPAADAPTADEPQGLPTADEPQGLPPADEPQGLPPAVQPDASQRSGERRSVTMPVAVPVSVALVLGLALGLILGWVLPRPGADAAAAGDPSPVVPESAEQTPQVAPTLDPAGPEPIAGGPDGTEELAGLVLGTQGPVVELFEDYVCPFCVRLEQASGAQLRQAALDGEFRLVLHPIAFLTEDSPRAANASACVYQHADQQDWIAYHEAVYAAQDPTEQVGQYTIPRLLDIAADVGVDSTDVTECIEGGTYDDWVAALTQQAFARGVTGTPTLAVDGRITDTSPLLQ